MKELEPRKVMSLDLHHPVGKGLAQHIPSFVQTTLANRGILFAKFISRCLSTNIFLDKFEKRGVWDERRQFPCALHEPESGGNNKRGTSPTVGYCLCFTTARREEREQKDNEGDNVRQDERRKMNKMRPHPTYTLAANYIQNNIHTHNDDDESTATIEHGTS